MHQAVNLGRDLPAHRNEVPMLRNPEIRVRGVVGRVDILVRQRMIWCKAIPGGLYRMMSITARAGTACDQCHVIQMGIGRGARSGGL